MAQQTMQIEMINSYAEGDAKKWFWVHIDSRYCNKATELQRKGYNTERDFYYTH